LGLPVLADTVQRFVNGAEGRAVMASRGHSTDYDVTVGVRASIVDMEARASSEAATLSTLEGLIELFNEELARRQQAVNAPPTLWASLQTVTQDAIATPDEGSTMRVVLVAGALSVAVAASGAVLWDTLVRRREA